MDVWCDPAVGQRAVIHKERVSCWKKFTLLIRERSDGDSARHFFALMADNPHRLCTDSSRQTARVKVTAALLISVPLK